MSTVLLDTHVLAWWAAEPDRVSARAARAIEAADEVAVAAISWYELAWLVERGRIATSVPMRSWIAMLARDVRTAALTPSVAAGAAALPAEFGGDPADRLIWATAVEHGWRLVTADGRLRAQDAAGEITLW